MLPIDEVVDEVAAALTNRGRVVLAAPPGAGKSTALPLRLLERFPERQRLLLLQPRRVAARAVASRLADQWGTPLGQRVGYQIRLERRWTRESQIVVMTYGVLLRRLQSDPLLEAFDTVLLDEFHERSLEADLTLGMTARLQDSLRDDLWLGVMSATLDAEPVAAYLEEAPLVVSRGRSHPVQLRHDESHSRAPMPDRVARAVERAAAKTNGHVLAFLPGVGEIHRTARQLNLDPSIEVLPLYGEMSADKQDRVLRESSRRKVILATNVAETSVTVDGVTAVVDSGRARVMRTDPVLGLPRLEIEPISQASAQQRAGRAGRTGPGVCYRLWPEKTHRARPEFDPPEVLRGDLTTAALWLHGWGEHDLPAFPWLTPPRPEAIEIAERTLQRLDAVREGRITPLGEAMLRLPAHPRLARLMLSGLQLGIAELAAACAALLSEKDPFLDARGNRTKVADPSLARADLVDRVVRLREALEGASDPCIAKGAIGGVRAAYRQFVAALDSLEDRRREPTPAGEQAATDEQSSARLRERLSRSLLLAFPDRLARRRGRGDDRGLMVGQRGVRLKDRAVPPDAEYFLCVELLQKTSNAEVRRALPIAPQWLDASMIEQRRETFFHPSQRRIIGRERTYWLDLVLSETPCEVGDRQAAGAQLAEQVANYWQQVFPADDATVGPWIARVNFLAATLGNDTFAPLDEAKLRDVARQIAADKLSLSEIREAPWLDYLKAELGFERMDELDRWAPAEIEVPSGSRVPVDYSDPSAPAIRVRLQELFGWSETPRIAGERVPLLLRILAPNYREVQVTRDLANFWKATYAEVRKEMRRRYPKHQWPENPHEGRATRSGLKKR
jgi:ATP-dependent helicase HrpB